MKKNLYLNPEVEVIVDLDLGVLCNSTTFSTEDFNDDTIINW